jgi:hypothetical protein
LFKIVVPDGLYLTLTALRKEFKLSPKKYTSVELRKKLEDAKVRIEYRENPPYEDFPTYNFEDLKELINGDWFVHSNDKKVKQTVSNPLVAKLFEQLWQKRKEIEKAKEGFF